MALLSNTAVLSISLLDESGGVFWFRNWTHPRLIFACRSLIPLKPLASFFSETFVANEMMKIYFLSIDASEKLRLIWSTQSNFGDRLSVRWMHSKFKISTHQVQVNCILLQWEGISHKIWTTQGSIRSFLCEKLWYLLLSSISNLLHVAAMIFYYLLVTQLAERCAIGLRPPHYAVKSSC